jgi:ADP-heptose:LPS heptosyltransferase
MFNTPILFIIFNRPDVTGLVFDEIKKVQPKQLFIAADGPRVNRPSDLELCHETRSIINQIDWPCEVKTLFREQNLGCGKAVSSAISWFFSEVEEGIILEDDCLPHPTFFNYCQDLLEHYRHDSKVMHIGGVNFQNGNKRGEASYYFSAVSHVWGWASWRRAWNLYNFNVSDFYTFVREEKIYDYFPNQKLGLHWLQNFKSMYYHVIDTWDHQWSYSIMNNGGVSIIPNTNLISNIGFREDATHTSSSNSVYANVKTSAIQFPLKYEDKIELNRDADFYFFSELEGLAISKSSLIYTLRMNIKSYLSRTIEYVLRHYVFSSKFKTPKNNVLIQKIDSVGDYIITRNFFREVLQSEKYKGYNVYLLANIRLKTFIEETDKHLFKDVIYFDINDLSRIKTKYAFYYKVRKLKLDTIIHATFSRSVMSDEIVFHSGAKQAIVFLGDTSNISSENKLITDSYYSQLIDVDQINGNAYSHEFEKQKTFFETVLNKKINLSKPHLVVKAINQLNTKVVICPGAQDIKRVWSTENFGTLINLICDIIPDIDFTIVCGPNEAVMGENILQNSDYKSRVNLVHTLSLNELCLEISKGYLIIGNDSASIHIAVALNKKVVCISNGNHYRRFVPYPSSIYNDMKVVLPPAFNQNNIQNDKFIEFYYSNTSNLNINDVEIANVVDACKYMLNL